MITGGDLDSLTFGEPLYLWLLVAPAALLVLWGWQVLRRRAETQRFAREQVLPVRQHFTPLGELGFWLCVVVAMSLCIAALARPQARISSVRTAGADFVLLQDGSASMYARDISPDRWQRSIQFVRTFANTLRWQEDRVALALFAYFAAPQVRLTRDPNALFFFLDHLAERSPFRLEDNPTWGTNIEEGVEWGLKLVETQEEIFGRTNNPKAFVVISDGQAWSGRVENALAAARQRDTPVYVVGVGTTAGTMIPASTAPNAPSSGIRAALDRESLRTIAYAGGGQYFELGRESDRAIASRIISSVKQRSTVTTAEETREELYWYFLFAAALVLCVGTVVLRHRAELGWQAAGAGVALLIVLAGAFG